MIFDPNDGGPRRKVHPDRAAYKDQLSTIAKPTFSRAGYQRGRQWHIDALCTIPAPRNMKIAYDITFYADWAGEQAEYTVAHLTEAPDGRSSCRAPPRSM